MAAAARRRPVAISQIELETFRLMRASLTRQRRELEHDEAWVKQKEANLLERLGGGAHVESGRFSIGVEQAEVCNPSYKDELVAHFQQSHGVPEAALVEEVRKRYRKMVDRVVVAERPKAVR